MSVFVIFIIRLLMVTARETCTDLSNLKQSLQENARLKVKTFLTLNNSGLLQCVKECKLRSRCQSFNFNLDAHQCELLDTTSSETFDSNLLTTAQYVYSDIKSWSGHIAGKCEGHSCPSTTVCRENGSNHTCLCSDPPAVQNASLALTAQSQIMWEIGEEVKYVCDTPFSPRGRRVCQSDGSWTDFSCVLVRDCSQMKTCNNAYSDGEYWIVLEKYNNTRVKIYCHDMSSDTPGHFVTFQEDNYSVMPTGCTDFYCGRTNFSKMKIDLDNLEIELDHTFADWSCKPGPYGRIMGCNSNADSDCGTMQVNLVGTSFKVSSQTTLIGNADIVYSSNHSVMHGKCNGQCEACFSSHKGTTAKFGFSLREQNIPDEDSASVPACV
ncbi:A disintegrin and metalloproteinase with thrombospondin motifs 9-like [Haliotis cracherodii]|uniref:A disintegrin and metalloproteinase with thrombospondin motifs 9-like n=1 Tax=Haliotis cracherodii TaxID=6455 RepID=UPI0039EB0837